MTDGIENLGEMQQSLLLPLTIAWLIIFIILGKGLSQNGKVKKCDIRFHIFANLCAILFAGCLVHRFVPVSDNRHFTRASCNVGRRVGRLAVPLFDRL